MWLSSQARALADNTRRTRSRGERPAATLSDDELADWIDHLASQNSLDRLLALRLEAELLAPAAGVPSTISQMSVLVGSAVGTKHAHTGSRRLRARQAGLPYDHRRDEIFAALIDYLRATAPTPNP